MRIAGQSAFVSPLRRKILPEAHPGAYGVIRLVLGHLSVDTTTRAYCGAEAAAAMRHFDEHILQLRAKSPPLSKRMSRGTD